jgi:hypothetical protein
MNETVEHHRLAERRGQARPWLRWGPYLSERQWSTVREDYSADGNAWEHFPHDHARSRAYRWGEDGLAGISDDQSRLCFALALWNGRDAILKERLFGLTGNEGNHGEDVKEYYYYLDSTPTHSYMKMLYKYPQAAFPYAELVEENGRRGRDAVEHELIDTGVFAEDRYFDVVVEYAKAGPNDILARISATNRGPDAAALRLLPTLWFRNEWAWGGKHDAGPRPQLRVADASANGHGARYRRARAPRALHAGLRRRAGFALHRERDERPAALRRAEPDALRQGRHQRGGGAGARRRGQPRWGGDQGGRALSVDDRARRDGDDPPATRRRAARQSQGGRRRERPCAVPVRRLRRPLRRAAGRGGRLLRRAPAGDAGRG